ncbi:transporter substrate-binding domain-containing protein [Marinobacter sp.]|uniref:transporter substrate-binding domain-containing diguanylate cyclase n=1 Tax=Marinobacter sp. TaxID=50741 RepID=UPI0019C56796|nr:transporter substrate-binding domain-containing protein [Marinobacter sp.]MBC7191170.1 transporter substrate-binding domain-containing protein [Marinobacter sp.]
MCPASNDKRFACPGAIFSWLATFVLLTGSLLPFAVKAQPTDKPVVSIGIVADNQPYSHVEGRTASGFSVDILREVARHAGITFRFRAGSWPEIYSAFMSGELDAIDGISYQEDRARSILFTRPYHVRQTFMMYDNGKPRPRINSLNDLQHVRVGVVENIYYMDYLVRNDIDFRSYESIPALVRALAFGWVDVIIGPELTLDYYANRAGFRFLDILGPAPLGKLSREDFRVGVHRDNPELFQRLQQGLEAVPEPRIRELLQRWREYGGARAGETRSFALSDDQQALVQKTGPLRVGVMSDYAPFSFLANGQIQGLTVDILNRIADLTGLQFIPVPGRWANLFPDFRSGELDIMANMSLNPERAGFTRFTEPYHTIPVVAFTSRPDITFSELTDLAPYRVGLGAGIYYESPVRKQLDKVRAYDSQKAMFQGLADGEVDVVLAALANGNYWIRDLNLQSIRVVGELTHGEVRGEDLRFGLNPELEPVRNIMNLALAAISPIEKRSIEDRWLGSFRARTAEESRNLSFSPGEQEWLERHDYKLRVCLSPDSMPMEGLDENGRHTGYSGDVFRYFSGQSGIRFEPQPTRTWRASLEKIRQRECDLLSLAMKTPERLSYLNFTVPYLTLPVVVLGRLETPFFEDFTSLEGKALGVIDDFAFIDLMRARYPEIRLQTVRNEMEGLELVTSGELDGFLTTQVTASHYMQRLDLHKLKILGRAPFDWNLAVATRSDEPMLLGIMQKLVASMPEQMRASIESQWRTLQVRQAQDYTLLWLMLAITAVILALLFYWNRKLGRLNSELAQANARLSHLSVTDELTQLGNRSYFDRQLASSFQWCQRHKAGFALAMVDADHFKGINDTYGHQAGDECLKTLADTMRTMFRRDTDELARFGGEEFIILTTYQEADELIERLEQFRRTVAEKVTDCEGQQIRFTVSIGVALGTPAPDDLAESYLRGADKALYRAKQKGRNRVEVSSPDQPG